MHGVAARIRTILVFTMRKNKRREPCDASSLDSLLKHAHLLQYLHNIETRKWWCMWPWNINGQINIAVCLLPICQRLYIKFKDPCNESQGFAHALAAWLRSREAEQWPLRFTVCFATRPWWQMCADVMVMVTTCFELGAASLVFQ